MRVKTLILCSSSFAILTAGAAAPAWAQDTTGGEQAQETPADSTDVTPADEEEAIVVTGLRQSLQSQQNIRRNSDQIVDSIVAEDIGKLPDIAVSDTAARIPGVQVERGGGEAGRVLVRGLPDYSTTYNGREIFTAETRVVALQDFPAGLIGAIEVFKTSTADLIEPGLAGLINVRSRRPFDFGDGLNVAGSIWGLYTRQADEITPNGNLTISNRWDVGDGGQMGVLLGLSYTRLEYLDSIRSNTDFVAGPPQGPRFPDVQRITYGTADRTRPSINGAIQFRPRPGLEFYIEGLWQGFRNRISDRETTVPLWGGPISNVETRDGRPDLLESGTVTNPFRPDGFQGGTFNKTDTYQFAIGGSWDSGPLRISADVARTDSTFTGSTASVDFAFADRQTITFDTDVDAEDGGPEFSFANFDPTNPANYVYRGFYEQAQESSGDDWQARLDFDYDTGWAAIPEVEFGVRFTDRDAHREFGDRYHPAEGLRLPFSAVPLTYELFRPGFRGSSVQSDYRTWLSPTYRSIRDNLVELRQFTIANGGTHFTLDPVAPDPLQTFDADEQNFAAYAQLRYEFGLGGEVTVDGNIGLRYAKADTGIVGTQLIFTDPDGNGPLAPVGAQTAVDIEREFEDWLPNASARIRFTPQLQARLSFTQTRTRPTFTDLRPNFIPDAPPSCFTENPVPESCRLFARGGNPLLNQLTSDNYDAALEYYFSNNGFIALSVFRRDLDNFIETSVSEATDIDGLPIRVERPINSGAGRIQGFEVQFNTFFDFLGLPQFGVQANLTHLDAGADFTYNPGQGNERSFDRDLVGVSDWSYNLIGIYEAGGLSARLAYNWRSEFLTTFQVRGDHLYTEEADPVSRLDLSVSYDVMENLTLFGDWTNILGDPFTSSLTRTDFNAAGTQSTFPRVVRFEETTVSLGARFRF